MNIDAFVASRSPAAGAAHRQGQSFAASASQPIRIERVAAFDFLGSDYRALYAGSCASAFQHPIWLDRAFAHLSAASGGKPQIVTGRSADGRLHLVLPLLSRRRGPLALFDGADFGVCDYNGLVADPDILALLATPAGDGLRRSLRGALAGHALGRIRCVREDEAGLFAALGRRRTFMGFHAHEVALRAPFATWRSEALSTDMVRFLDRKRRRLGRRGVLTFREVTAPAEIAEVFAAMRTDRNRRFAGDALQDQHRFAFYIDVATRGCLVGLTRTYVLSLDGCPIGTLFGIKDRHRFLFLLLGFSEAYKNDSTGLLTLESVIEDCIGRGETVFDLTIGDEAYKAVFSPRRTRMVVVWTGNPALAWLADRTFTGVVGFRRFLASDRGVRLMRTAAKARSLVRGGSLPARIGAVS